MTTLDIDLPDSAATEAEGARLASLLRDGGVVFLSGELGAGKTTLVRALLRALGHEGAVRSPTYAIVEPYRIGTLEVYHLDLYRIADPDELEYLGLREWLRPGVLVLVEWPQRGAGLLPPPDLHLHLDYAGEGRVLHVQAGDRLRPMSTVTRR
jgi:tRNA threonylcarbamoyladenosine biosynthesis protein TsaE